jgi:hypothetical protein
MVRRKGGIGEWGLEQIRKSKETPPPREQVERLDRLFTGRSRYDPPDYDEETTEQDSAYTYYSVDDIKELYNRLGMSYDEDFGPYRNIQPVPYGTRPPFVGPYQSSRLVAHQFVADQSTNQIVSTLQSIESGTLSRQMFGSLITGTVYVKWKKPSRSTGQAYWKYGPGVSLETYREFAKSPSKGQYVKQLEQYGHVK